MKSLIADWVPRTVTSIVLVASMLSWRVASEEPLQEIDRVLLGRYDMAADESDVIVHARFSDVNTVRKMSVLIPSSIRVTGLSAEEFWRGSVVNALDGAILTGNDGTVSLTVIIDKKAVADAGEDPLVYLTLTSTVSDELLSLFQSMDAHVSSADVLIVLGNAGDGPRKWAQLLLGRDRGEDP